MCIGNVQNHYLQVNEQHSAAESLQHLKQTMKEAGYEVVTSRGDFIHK